MVKTLIKGTAKIVSTKIVKKKKEESNQMKKKITAIEAWRKDISKSILTPIESLENLMTRDCAFKQLQCEILGNDIKKGYGYIIETGKYMRMNILREDPTFVEIELDASESSVVQCMLNKMVVGSMGSGGNGLSLPEWRKSISGKTMSDREMVDDLRLYSKAWSQHMYQEPTKSGMYRDMKTGKCHGIF